MKVSLAQQELGALMKSKLTMQLQGRTFDYDDERRVKELRAFLDEQKDDVKTDETTLPGTTVFNTTNNNADNIPF